MSRVHENALEKSSSVDLRRSMDSAKVIGARLKAIRAHFGDNRESQAMFAARFGAEKTAWSNWETGYRVIPVETADRMCTALGISLDWLYRSNAAAMPAKLLQQLEPALRKRA